MVTENKQFEREFLCYSMDFLAIHDRTKNAKKLNSTDKIIMPESALDHLQRYHNILCPYVFQLTNKDMVAYCGVLEFTSESPHVIYVPKWLMLNLGLTDGDRVDVTSVNLQKGESIVLRPQSEMFFKLSNPKSVLEHHLKRFTVLYQGEILSIEYLGKTFDIDVIETKPDVAIDITDTDLKLEFVNMFDSKTKDDTKDEPSKPSKLLKPNDDEPDDYWSKIGPGKTGEK